MLVSVDLHDIGVDNVTESTEDNIARLLREIPGEFWVEDEAEVMVYAAVLLDQQNRVQENLSTGLQKHELIWAALYPHLLAHGYRLRPRFAPGWRHTGEPGPGADGDGRREFYERLPDAKPEPRTAYRATSVECIETGERKYVKLLKSCEKDILQFLNAEPQRSDPHNVCVPLHGFVECPSVSTSPSPFTLALMPCLRGFAHMADSGVLGFSLDVLQQALEGMAFLHRIGIAHGDIKIFNVVLSNGDPPLKLYFIDFGSATWFSRGAPMQTPGEDSDREHADYKADVDRCGRTFASIMYKASPHFDELEALMTAESPDARPTAAECLEVFNSALQRLPWQINFVPAFLPKTSYQTGGFPALIDNLRRRQLTGRQFAALKRAAAVQLE